MKSFNKICNAIIKLYTYIGVLMLSVIIVACVIQVFSRYVLDAAVPGTEEISRYCFIWLGFIGGAVCAQRWSNAWISILHDLTHGKFRKWHAIFLDIMVIICAGVLLIQGVNCVNVTSRQLSSMMRIPMCYVYAAIPVGSVGIIIGTLQRLVNHLAGTEMEVSA